MKTLFGMKCTGGLALVLAVYGAGCTDVDGGTARIDVTERNALGVVTLEIDRSSQDGNDIFALRGLDADEHEVASFRLTTGVFAGLDVLPAADTDRGSELLFTAGGQETRQVTREVNEFVVAPSFGTEIKGFLALGSVAAVLEKEAHVTIMRPGTPSTEVAHSDTCSPSIMNTSPVAKQCCKALAMPTNMFQLPTNAIVTRFQGNICKSSSGGSCLGAACYFGPNGFSRPVQSAGTTSTRTVGTTNDLYLDDCQAQEFTPTYGYNFGNVTGTFPTGRGCPGGLSGAGQWDY